MARLADKLTLLLEAGNGLADRMHLIVQASRDQRARLPSLNDKSVTKALEGILKKWPDVGPDADRAQGIDQVITKARGEFERLEGFYNTVLDLCEWKEAAVQALNETANTIHTYKHDETPVFFTNFLDLLVLLGQLLLLIPEISDRRAFLVMYRLLYYNLKGGIEVNFAKLSHFVADYEERWRKLPDELKTVSPKAGAAVCALAMDWFKMRDVNVLRKEGTLSLTLTPASLTLPVVDNFVYAMINSERMYKWLVYGFLLCPEEMALSDALAVMKSVLAVAYAAPVVRDVSYQMHEHYDDVIDKHKNKTFKAVLKKEKKLVDEALAAAVTTKHKDRRTFIRQEVTNLCNIMRDQPGLLAPKLPVILSTLAVAKEEVLWYFRHVEAPMPKGTKRTEILNDPRIGELIYHMQLLVSLVQAQRSLIGKYYATYLAGPHAQKARELLGEISSKLPAAAPLLKHIAEELQGVNEASDLKGLRATWARAECLHASAISGAAGAGTAMAKYALMIRHTRYVDNLDVLLDEVANLKSTYYWRDSVVTAFDRTLESHQHSMYILAFFRLYASWPGNATKWTPEERDVVGTDSVTIAKSCMERMMGRMLGLVNVQVKAWLEWEAQLTTENAAYAWLVRLKDSRPDKYFPVPPIEPGSESGFKLRPGLEALRQAELCLGNLCSALNEVPTITVFDHRFAPREYLREALAASFKDFVQRVALPIQGPGAEDTEVPRPSLVERQVAVYVNVLKTIENFLELNTGDLVREVYIGQVHHKVLSGLLTDWCADAPVDLAAQMVKPFVIWYTEYVTKRIVPSDKNTTVFAPNRTGFCSKPGQAFRAERLGDLVELRAFSSLVGPYGVRLLDRELLRAVQTALLGVREVLVANKVVLDELGKTYTREGPFADSVRKIKQQDLDAMVARLINAGNALHMRSVLHEGLRQVTSERIPYIFNAITAASNQYPRNTFSITDYLATDELSKQIGVPVQSADHGLKAFLQRGMGGSDVGIWSLAPVAFATALFYSRTWQDADYRPALEAHNNNVSATSLAISEILTAFKSTPNAGTIPDPKDVCNVLMQFVEMGAALALRAVRTPPQGKGKTHCASVIAFLDRFVEASPFITRDMVEPVLPYAFIRTMYRDLYDANNEQVDM